MKTSFYIFILLISLSCQSWFGFKAPRHIHYVQLLEQEKFQELEEAMDYIITRKIKTTDGVWISARVYTLFNKEINDRDELKSKVLKWQALSNHYLPDLLESKININLAWYYRGSNWANTVTKGGWSGFRKHINLAYDNLITAYTKQPNDPEIIATMFTVLLGKKVKLTKENNLNPSNNTSILSKNKSLIEIIVAKLFDTLIGGKDTSTESVNRWQKIREAKEEREKIWLERGNKIDPLYRELVSNFSHYLLPRWHGSDEKYWQYFETIKALPNSASKYQALGRLFDKLPYLSDSKKRKEDIKPFCEQFIKDYPNEFFSYVIASIKGDIKS